MSRYFAFIDESGNHDLDTSKNGVSKYYVVASIVCMDTQLEKLEESINSLRQKHYGNGEIKSSSTQEARRLKFLNDLMDVDFKFIALAVNKDDLQRTGGFPHKKSFVKFLHGRLYKNLISTYQDISIKADEYGREEFMQGFRKYIADNHIPDLFHTCTVEHVKSNNDVLIQLADLLAGTIRIVYEDGAAKDLRDAFIKLALKSKLAIDEWPPKYSRRTQTEPAKEHDEFVFNVAMNGAANFIVENSENTDDELSAQIIVLKYLLFHAQFVHSEYISAGELRDHLVSCGYDDYTERKFNSSVISRLRDNGVLISSCNKGYKIPQIHSDYMDFVELVNTHSIPLLERLKRAKMAPYKASMGEVGNFEEPQYEKLRRVMQALGD